MANRPKISASMSKVSVNGETNGAAAHSTATMATKTIRPRIYSSFPSMPPGRTISTASMSRYMSASARSSK